MTNKETIIKHASDYYISYDENGLISNESKERFNKNGFITFPPGTINKKELNDFFLESNSKLADWSDGKVDLNSCKKDAEDNFKNFFIRNNVNYSGCPLRHRITRGNGSAFVEDNVNWLIGKRAHYGPEFWNHAMTSIIENSEMQKIAKSLLNADELSFHNGSAARTYPGSEGESRSFHNDVSGFTRDPLKVVKKGRFVLNIFTYLSDVTEELSPLKVIPESHNEYLHINEYIAQNNNTSSQVNMVGKSQPLYEEILPDCLLNPVKIIGEKGTIIAFRNDLLHATSANKNQSKTRTALICNYANREHTEIFQQYRKEKESLANKVSDTDLIASTFLGKHQHILLRDIKRDFAGFRLKLRSKKSTLLWLYNNIRYSYYRNPSPLNARKYLNVGAGSNWNHPLFISTDQAPGTSMCSDLSKPVPLPFTQNRFMGIYASHFFEHLKYSEAQYLMKDLYRCLNKGGVIRIVVPDMEKYLNAYKSKKSTDFIYSSRGGIYPQDSLLRFIIRQFAEPIVDKYSDNELYEIYSKLDEKSFLDFFESEVNKENDKRLMIPDAHKTWYCESKMRNLLQESGFKNIVSVKPNDSSCNVFCEEFRQLDGAKPGRNLLSVFMEGTKE
jgi:predicted SAM-dependent methyltransferase/ectoine hydroxylase-related dioxygenase (phytanoyl-CoA dioxygenase family)